MKLLAFKIIILSLLTLDSFAQSPNLNPQKKTSIIETQTLNTPNFDIRGATRLVNPALISIEHATEAGRSSARLMDCLKKHAANK